MRARTKSQRIWCKEISPYDFFIIFKLIGRDREHEQKQKANHKYYCIKEQNYN